MTKDERAVSMELLRTILRFDAETGALYWKPRDVSMFKTAKDPARASKSWNTRFANQRAFVTNQGMGYFHGAIGNQKFLAHRVVFAMFHGRWPRFTVDHINGIKKDNSPANLRDVKHKDNCSNQKLRTTNTTGAMGISIDKDRRTFVATISVDGKTKHLGRFALMSDAVSARNAASVAYGFHINHGRKMA